MVALTELLDHCNNLLKVNEIKDYCPNGLQVEGTSQITKLISGVTANEQLIDHAIQADAGAILVHHGYFWKNEDPRLTGMKGKRVQKLLQHNINLIAYHLPLDLHPIYGNNSLWGQSMRFNGQPDSQNPLIYYADLPQPMDIQELSNLLQECLHRKPLHLPGGNKMIHRVAWCSGAAQSYIERAAELHANVFLSGEVSEQTTHLAKELHVDFFACGHHATEIFGVKNLGEHIAQKFGVVHNFIDIPNPV